MPLMPAFRRRKKDVMGLDDEVLKRYGLPKLTVKRALIKAYETVVLDQQR
jgi:hypothetical protein